MTKFEDFISFLLEHWLMEKAILGVQKGENIGMHIYIFPMNVSQNSGRYMRN